MTSETAARRGVKKYARQEVVILRQNFDEQRNFLTEKIIAYLLRFFRASRHIGQQLSAIMIRRTPVSLHRPTICGLVVGRKIMGAQNFDCAAIYKK